MGTKNDLVGDLYLKLIEELMGKLKAGTLSPTDRKLIAQIAKEHGVQLDVTDPKCPINDPLPFSLEDLTVESVE